MPRCSVEPYSMAPSTRMPPAIISTRGRNIDTRCDDRPRPTPSAITNGMKPTPARNAL